nr:hypothetical protein TR92_07720 [Brucella anthropi]
MLDAFDCQEVGKALTEPSGSCLCTVSIRVTFWPSAARLVTASIHPVMTTARVHVGEHLAERNAKGSGNRFRSRPTGSNDSGTASCGIHASIAGYSGQSLILPQ